ncbi:MAG: hypothetical protein U0354_08365 [Candidatus Sericytochromatia bacterium]
MRNNSISLKIWSKLYKLIIEFYKLKPWEWMTDHDLFGVENPIDNKIGYCCIMGKLGRFKSLSIYLGTDGLESYLSICSGKVDAGSFEALLNQKCIMLSFEDIENLSEDDIEVVQALELNFEKNEFPLIRNYSQGYLPWFIDNYDADFLINSLEQVIEISLRAKECKRFINSDNKKFLVRVRKDEIWEDEYIIPKKNRAKDIKPLIDNDLIQKIDKIKIDKEQVWNIISINLPTPTRENNQRPYYPYIMIISDNTTGEAFGFEITEYNKIFNKFPTILLNTIIENNLIPSKINVYQKEVKKMFNFICKKFNIEIKMNKNADKLKPIIEETIKIIHSQEMSEVMEM